MPPTPKVLNRKRLVRRVKVYRKPDIKKKRCADRHIAVTTKVEVELERIRETRAPCAKKIELCTLIEAPVRP